MPKTAEIAPAISNGTNSAKPSAHNSSTTITRVRYSHPSPHYPRSAVKAPGQVPPKQPPPQHQPEHADYAEGRRDAKHCTRNRPEFESAQVPRDQIARRPIPLDPEHANAATEPAHRRLPDRAEPLMPKSTRAAWVPKDRQLPNTHRLAHAATRDSFDLVGLFRAGPRVTKRANCTYPPHRDQSRAPMHQDQRGAMNTTATPYMQSADKYPKIRSTEARARISRHFRRWDADDSALGPSQRHHHQHPAEAMARRCMVLSPPHNPALHLSQCAPQCNHRPPTESNSICTC
jgi:hypothetical protein